MLAKAACLVAALVSHVLSYKPPTSSKTVDPKKEQKVVSEFRLLTDYANKFPAVMIAIAVLQTVLYLVFMTKSGNGSNSAASVILKGSSSLPLRDQVIFQEMVILKTWQMAATVGCVLGYALRKWSFVTLDRFFTVRNVLSASFTERKKNNYSCSSMHGFLINLFGTVVLTIGFSSSQLILSYDRPSFSTN